MSEEKKLTSEASSVGRSRRDAAAMPAGCDGEGSREGRWAKDVLAFDPFEGDRDVDVTVFRDRIVIARKPGPCHLCAGPIAAGERCRSRTDTCDGEIGTFRFCLQCCDAMAVSWTDDGDAIGRIYTARWNRDRLKDAV